MQTVLKHLAKQANLERILFSPGLKKMYFDLAVGAGGAAQFKHADSVRNGISSVLKDHEREKRSLLFCYTHELIAAYDLMLQTAVDLRPVAVLTVRGSHPPKGSHWSDLELRRCGWVVMYTHTLQELYDHLAMAYHVFVEKKFSLPVLIVHSALKHASSGTWNRREGVHLGTGAADFVVKKSGTKSFADAFAALEKKKTPPSLPTEMAKVIPTLRDVYPQFGYPLPQQGLPIFARNRANDTAVLSPLPLDDESMLDDLPFDWVRPFCGFPHSIEPVTEILVKKKTLMVVEPPLLPGSGVPPYFAEWNAALAPHFSGGIHSVVLSEPANVLKKEHIEGMERYGNDASLNQDKTIRFYVLEV